jgi:hypothetical protein
VKIIKKQFLQHYLSPSWANGNIDEPGDRQGVMECDEGLSHSVNTLFIPVLFIKKEVILRKNPAMFQLALMVNLS